MRVTLVLLVCVATIAPAGVGSAPVGENDAIVPRETICEVAHDDQVAPALLAGVILAEAANNRSFVDDVEDEMLRVLLARHPEPAWWQEWARRGFEVTEHADSERMIANKWPLEVVASGFVVSVGPAQVTPRTALRACAAIPRPPRQCRDGVRSIVAALLEPQGAVAIASVVLRFEAQECADLLPSADIAAMATLYNLGCDFYRGGAIRRGAQGSNDFGRWVAGHAPTIERTLHCGDDPTS